MSKDNWVYTVSKVVTRVDCGRDEEGTRLEGARVRKLYQEQDPDGEYYFDIELESDDEV